MAIKTREIKLVLLVISLCALIFFWRSEETVYIQDDSKIDSLTKVIDKIKIEVDSLKAGILMLNDSISIAEQENKLLHEKYKSPPMFVPYADAQLDSIFSNLLYEY